MRGWINDERRMIPAALDGTTPVIFQIERRDYNVLYIDNISKVIFYKDYIEICLQNDVDNKILQNSVNHAAHTLLENSFANGKGKSEK